MDKLILITIGSIIIIGLSIFMKIKNDKAEVVEEVPLSGNVFKDKKAVNVSVSQAKELIKTNKDLLILDTRSKAEYRTGHIEGAIIIPYNKLEMNLDELDGYEDKPILVYCLTGSRSAVAVNTLIENGFNKIYHMNRGYTKWK